MSTVAKATIGFLIVAIVALAIGLGVVLAHGGDDRGTSAGWGPGMGPYHAIMMGSGGWGDWQDMQEYMRGVLGEDGYQSMLQNMTENGCPWAQSSNGGSNSWPAMGYGMMGRYMGAGATSPGSCR
jgi:hypothetical protein